MGLISWAIGKAYDSAKESHQRSVAIDSGALNHPLIRYFFENTHMAWTAGILGQGFCNEAMKLGVDGLILNYPPTKYPIIDHFFRYLQPMPDEFLVGMGENEFLLTNQRLIISDHRANQYIPLGLALITFYRTEGSWTKKCSFGLNTGQVVVLDQLSRYPSEAFVQKILYQRIWLWQRPR